MNRSGKDEMNLAVLPISKLGKNDKRNVIKYYGTFNDGDGQKEMVWTVRGAHGLGLPNELGDRIVIALLYIGVQNGFKDRRLEFSVYQVLKVLGLEPSGRNYKAIEKSLSQIAGILVTSDQSWVEKSKDGDRERVTSSRGFHIIEEYYLHYQENNQEGDRSFVVWGARMWHNIQAGYLKSLDIDFYYSLKNPLTRRLYRFLDKITYHRPSRPYTIDIFALANKLGMTAFETRRKLS